MQLTILGSNSQGNGYILKSSLGEVLLIEAGIPFQEVKKALNFELSGIEGLIASHCHNDHFKFVKQYLQAGIKVYSSQETADLTGLKRYNFMPMAEKQMISIGSYLVMPFPLKHDVKNFGFIINHKEMGNTTFITDTQYCPFRFKNLSNIIIEANYSMDIVDKNMMEQKGHLSVRNRVLESHMEFDVTKEFLASNDLSKVNNIVLIHLSDGNSDEKRFNSEIQNLTGKTVHVAIKGLTIPFNKTPF